MAELLTTSGIAHYLEQVIKKAKSKVYIISPYLDISHNFLQRLLDAEKKGIEINIVYRDDKLNQRERKKFQRIKKLNLYHHQLLHAKCYANEEFVIITSMNMIEYSEKKNREMGVLFNKTEDEVLYLEALEEIESIRDDSEIISSSDKETKTYKKNPESYLNSTQRELKNFLSYAIRKPVDSFDIDTDFKVLGLNRGLDPEYYWDKDDDWEKGESIEEFIFNLEETFHFNIDIEDIKNINSIRDLASFIDRRVLEIKESIKPSDVGYCIRDGIMIPFNPKLPMCDRAYNVWKRYNNPDYEESYCHKTGKHSNGKTSFRNPILFEK